MLIDRDRLVNASSEEVAAMTVLLFDRLQAYHTKKETQVLALAAAFLLTCEVLRVSPQDAFSAITNLMADPLHADGIKAQFAGMKYHLETELLK